MSSENEAMAAQGAAPEPTPTPARQKPAAGATARSDARSVRGLLESDFPKGKHQEQVDKLRDEALRIQGERIKEAKATKPWDKRRSLVRRDMFAVGSEDARARLAQRGLEVCFINEKEELDDYLDQGYRVATKADVGGLRDNTAQDSQGVDTVLRRREMVGVIGPVTYRQDRMLVEEAQALDQLGQQDSEDKLLGLTGITQRMPGRFGKQKKALGLGMQIPTRDDDD